MTFKLVKVDYNYCNYLRRFDSKVTFNYGQKELRPFIGVLFPIDDKEYFAPLSSPKPKHKKMKNTLDFFKIDNGTLGAINFNNMIPVKKNNYTIISLNKKNLKKDELNYQELLKNQLSWLNSHQLQIKNKAKLLYIKYINDKLNKKIYDRCCNFLLLEKKCDTYNKQKIFV